MRFLKNFFMNLLYVIIICVLLLILLPDFMRGVFQAYAAIFGPGLLLLLVLVAALPRRRWRR